MKVEDVDRDVDRDVAVLVERVNGVQKDVDTLRANLSKLESSVNKLNNTVSRMTLIYPVVSALTFIVGLLVGVKLI